MFSTLQTRIGVSQLHYLYNFFNTKKPLKNMHILFWDDLDYS